MDTESHTDIGTGLYLRLALIYLDGRLSNLLIRSQAVEVTPLLKLQF